MDGENTQTPQESSAPASGTPSTSATPGPGTAAPVAGAAAASDVSSDFSSPESFDWDSWDGEDYGAFSEPVRPWVERVNSYHKSRFDQALSEERDNLQSIRSIYDDLLSSHEDPRLKQLEGKYQQSEQKYQELQDKFKAKETEALEMMRAFEQMQQAEAQRQADRFKAQHGDIFEDPKKIELLGELLDEDWDLDNIPRVMKLDPDIRDQVRTAKREGTPEQWALKIAEQWKPKPAKPRAGAELVSGAVGPVPAPNLAHETVADSTNFEDLRSRVIAKAMSRR